MNEYSFIRSFIQSSIHYEYSYSVHSRYLHRDTTHPNLVKRTVLRIEQNASEETLGSMLRVNGVLF